MGERTGDKKRSRRAMIVLLLAGLVVAGLITRYLVTHRPPVPKPPPPAPLEGRTELVGVLAAENVLDSIDNLPNFDDTVWALGGMGNSLVRAETYRFQRTYIPALSRVRKILQQAPQHRAEVVARLKEKLLVSSEGFEKIKKEFDDEVTKSEKGLTLSAPNDCFRRTIFAPAATCLLEELDAFDALPVMRRVYALKEQLPVGRVFLFYAMHRLAGRHPRDRLSPEAAKALDEYLTETRDLPPPQGGLLTAWNAAFDESDFRHALLREDIGLEKQPRIRMSMYPESLADLEDHGGKPSPKVNEYFRRFCTFVDLAYPAGG